MSDNGEIMHLHMESARRFRALNRRINTIWVFIGTYCLVQVLITVSGWLG